MPRGFSLEALPEIALGEREEEEELAAMLKGGEKFGKMRILESRNVLQHFQLPIIVVLGLAIPPLKYLHGKPKARVLNTLASQDKARTLMNLRYA